MDAKATACKFDEQQAIYIISKYLPTNLKLINGKEVILQWRNLATITLTK